MVKNLFILDDNSEILSLLKRKIERMFSELDVYAFDDPNKMMESAKDDSIYIVDFLLPNPKNGLDVICGVKNKYEFSNIFFILYSALISNAGSKHLRDHKCSQCIYAIVEKTDPNQLSNVLIKLINEENKNGIS